MRGRRGGDTMTEIEGARLVLILLVALLVLAFIEISA